MQSRSGGRQFFGRTGSISTYKGEASGSGAGGIRSPIRRVEPRGSGSIVDPLVGTLTTGGSSARRSPGTLRPHKGRLERQDGRFATLSPGAASSDSSLQRLEGGRGIGKAPASGSRSGSVRTPLIRLDRDTTPLTIPGIDRADSWRAPSRTPLTRQPYDRPGRSYFGKAHPFGPGHYRHGGGRSFVISTPRFGMGLYGDGDYLSAALRIGRPGYLSTNPFRHRQYHYGWNGYRSGRHCGPSDVLWYTGFHTGLGTGYDRYPSHHYADRYSYGWPSYSYCTSRWYPRYRHVAYSNPWSWYYPSTCVFDYWRSPSVTHVYYYGDDVYREGYAEAEGVAEAAQAPGIYVEGQEGARSIADIEEWTYFDLGYLAFLEERYDEAQGLFLQAMWANEDEALSALMLGFSAFARGDYTIATVAVRQALRAREDLIESPLALRSVYRSEDTLIEQLNSLITHVDSRPTDREARFLLGYVYFAMERPEVALPIVEELAQSDPQDTVALYLVDAVTRVLAISEESPPPTGKND